MKRLLLNAAQRWLCVGLFLNLILVLLQLSCSTTEPAKSATQQNVTKADEYFEELPDGKRPPKLKHKNAKQTIPLGVSMQATGSLTGRIVFTSGGHGWTYSNGRTNRYGWYTQRGVTHEMNEDYGNLDQMNLFVPYCFNAGATVVAFRPIGQQTNEVILDNTNPNVKFLGKWLESGSSIYYGNAGDVPYRFAGLESKETATATYAPVLPESGFYPVYTWARQGADRTSQLYYIRHSGGTNAIRIPHHMVGSGWVYLGTYYFEKGQSEANGAVIVSNLQPSPGFGRVAVADAIRFGNGIGDVIPTPAGTETTSVSGYPREEEASRYWVQRSVGQGQPSSLYNGDGDDTSDNVGAPPRMARNMNREVEGNIFKRVLISFHSNAGGGRGCVGLWNDENLFPGTGTPHQKRLAELIGLEMNNDMVALNPELEVPWFDRSNRIVYARNDYAFGELNNKAISNEFDATIIEVAFHDNDSDAKLLRDPKVRGWMGRSTYRAVVRYMNEFDKQPIKFLPEPPINVRAVASRGGAITVQWEAPDDGTNSPTGYIVTASLNGYGFGNPVRTSRTTATFTNLAAGVSHYFRVVSVNAGGESLPSETVGCRAVKPGVNERILIINAFDRMDRGLNPRQTAGPGMGSPSNTNRNTFERVQPRRSNSFDYVVQHGDAASANEVAFDSCQRRAVANDQVDLMNYSGVIWALGRQLDAFEQSELDRLKAYQKAGGVLFVSGEQIGKGTNATASIRSFLENYPGAVREDEIAETVFVKADAGKAAFLGTAFESIEAESTRKETLHGVLKFIGLGTVLDIVIPEIKIDGYKMVLKWPTEAGKSYQVQYKRNRDDAIWKDYGAVIKTDDATAKVEGDPAKPSQIYRILVAP